MPLQLPRPLKSLMALFVFGFLWMAAPVAMAAPYTLTGGGLCYDHATHGYVALSFCSNANNQTTAESTLAGIILPPPKIPLRMTGVDCSSDNDSLSPSETCKTTEYTIDPDTGKTTASKLTKSCTTTSSGVETCTDYGVRPSDVSIAVLDLSAGLGYGQTNIDSDASLLGTKQQMSTTAIAVSLRQDFGDWGYTVWIPLRHTENNGQYSALDNKQLGVTFAPSYHLFKEQVHGMTLDLGGRLGYNYTSFSDVNAVRDTAGVFQYADFSDLKTAFVSLNASFGKQLVPETRLQLGFEAIGYHNEGAESMMGKNGNMLLATAGLSHQLSDKLSVRGNIQAIQFHQNSFDDTSRYNVIGLGLTHRVSNFSVLSFDLSRSVGGDGFDTTAASLNFAWALN